MGKTDGNEQQFHSGKELLEGCIKKLNEGQRGESGGNLARYPVVVIMMGEKSREHMRHIKDTLDANWNNARFLRYLNVVKKEDGFKCRLLKSAEYYGAEEKWDTKETDFADALNAAIINMLEEDEKIFTDKSSVKMEFVLDGAEEDGKDYYDLFLDTNSQFHTNDLKTLYLMLDQNPLGGRVEASDEVLQYIKTKKEENYGGTIYLLSNYLQSGNMLGKNKIWQNYRLVANIILLGGNKKGVAGSNKNLYNGIKTVSYALKTKRTEEIAVIALSALLEEMYRDEEQNMSADISDKEVREKLQISPNNGIRFAEELFQKKIVQHFPDERGFAYLPFLGRNRDSLDKDVKKGQGNAMGIMKVVDNMTMEALSAYVRMYFLEPAESFWQQEQEKEECTRQIREILNSAFSFMDLLELSKKEYIVDDIFNSEYMIKGIGVRDTLERTLGAAAVERSRKLFSDIVKNTMRSELLGLLERAKKHEENYLRCQKEVGQEQIVTGEESESLEKFYTAAVKDFVSRNRKINAKESTFPQVFRTRESMEEILDAIWEVFLKMIREKTFTYNFEEEIDARMNNMNATQRQILVTQELQEMLMGSIRLKNAIDVAPMKMGGYYLINESAEYAKYLANAPGNGIDFQLFDINRTDCIEQIEVYDINRPELLHLIDFEE